MASLTQGLIQPEANGREGEQKGTVFLIDSLTNYHNLEGSKEYAFYTWDM